MFKLIFKEIIIVLLLIFAIILLLGILFYDYMPNSKIVPQEVEEYAMDEEIQDELKKELNNINSEEIVKTYMFDATDIEGYERTKQYNKGKPNPFAPNVSENVGANNNSGAGANNSGTGSNANNNSNAGTNSNTSTGTFLNTVGK